MGSWSSRRYARRARLYRRGAARRRLGVVLAIALLAVLAWRTAPTAHAQTSPAALVLTSTRELAFGRFVAGADGTVSIAPAGMRSGSGGVILLPSGASAAQFHLDRAAGAQGAALAVSLSLPAARSVVLSSGAARMTVGAFQAWPASIVSIPDGGVAIHIGATLEVAAGQAPGNYQGAFALTVNYE
jgi:Domain of unknown function (DUF4402)